MLAATNAFATSAASRAKNLVGFDPTAIITILLPIALNIIQSCGNSSPKDVKETLADHYDENTQSFDLSTINRMRPYTRRQSKKSGHTGLTRVQLDAITEATLKQALESDDATLAAVMSEQAQIEP